MTKLILASSIALLFGCTSIMKGPEIQQWTTYEATLTSEKNYENGYTDTDVWAVFKNNKGDSLHRPAFWDGGHTWKIRFTPPDAGTLWTWKSYAIDHDKGLEGQTGSLSSVNYTGENNLLMHGLLKMSSGKRNVVHADSTPFLVVGDTPWSIPFRATYNQVTIYAKDRQQKGFNTVLLMSVQPDQFAEGPEARDTVLGFDRGFEDLHQGHLNKLKPDYFQYLDSLIYILVEHEIVPVYQPVFHGFGWKGKTVLGVTADVYEYARYCKYLVARFGSMPAFWLVSGDGTGRDQGVKPGGEEVEKWDCYSQPTGIHYNPADNFLAAWAQGDSTKCFHFNRTYQEEPWLDFQWAQTGHDGNHLTYKVEGMYENQPTKANLNGEPTYEGMGGGKLGLGWWQGEEAWTQLMHGGTMGVVYGAAGLWQWKVTPDEVGWAEWTDQPVSWREALALEGSNYVGYVSKAFQGFDFTDMEKRWDLTEGNKPLLASDGKFYVAYLATGGKLKINNLPLNLPYFWFNPKTGELRESGKTNATGQFNAPDANPWVVLVGERSIGQ
ncbi:MAG: DUF4038 domain-containing protein [Bacteroidia bacterium]|nr:DUF4038 domain-containing protein [Bacteroidia bacterium]